MARPQTFLSSCNRQEMAKAKAQAQPARIERQVSRPGVHAKTKQGTHKRGKNWRKPYRGQGR